MILDYIFVVVVFQMQAVLDWDSGAMCSAPGSPTYWLSELDEVWSSSSLSYPICKMDLLVVASVKLSEPQNTLPSEPVKAWPTLFLGEEMGLEQKRRHVRDAQQGWWDGVLYSEM